MANRKPNMSGLKPWPKGKSGNPGGWSRKGRATHDFMALIDENPGELRELSKVWLEKCKAGDYQFFREYLDRSDGKVAPAADEPEDSDSEDLGILVRVPTVRQAERMAKAKAKQKAKRSSARGKPDGPVAG